MDQHEYIQHWNYFCSIASRLDDTKDYIYHGINYSEDSPKMIHGSVYSDVFKQILLLSAAEFEILAKSLCKLKGASKTENIFDISKYILECFPKITKTEVITEFYTGTPLYEWSIDLENKVQGLEWWKAYNALKHDDAGSYKGATLENAALSLASLYIINLYFMYNLTGSLALAYNYPPVYYRSKYTAKSINSGEGLLPDYGDQSPGEVIRAKYPEMFE